MITAVSILKICTKCLKSKKLHYFYKFKHGCNGLQSKCKECTDAIHKIYSIHNRERIRLISKKSSSKRRASPAVVASRIAAKIERTRLRELNKQTVLNKQRQYYKNYRQTHKNKYAYYTATRQAAKLQRTPKWLNEEQKALIKKFYDKASSITIETGIAHEVDHIVPLQGKIVSGLHVPWNMQILTEKENNRKLNKW